MRVETVQGMFDVEAHVVRLMDAGGEALVMAAQDGVAVLVRGTENATPFPAVDRGKLLRSWKARKFGRRGAILESTTLQGGIMEYGTRPFTPPYEPVAFWVARKLGVPSSYVKDAKRLRIRRGRKGGKGGAGLAKMDRRARGGDRRAQLVRFKAIVDAVRRRIRTRGIKPRAIALKALPKLADIAMEYVMMAIDDVRA